MEAPLHGGLKGQLVLITVPCEVEWQVSTCPKAQMCCTPLPCAHQVTVTYVGLLGQAELVVGSRGPAFSVHPCNRSQECQPRLLGVGELPREQLSGRQHLEKPTSVEIGLLLCALFFLHCFSGCLGCLQGSPLVLVQTTNFTKCHNCPAFNFSMPHFGEMCVLMAKTSHSVQIPIENVIQAL